MSCTTVAYSYDLPLAVVPGPYIPKIAVEKHTCCDIKSGDELVYYATVYNLSDADITIDKTHISDTLVIKNAAGDKTVDPALVASFVPDVLTNGLTVPAGESVNLRITFNNGGKYPLKGWKLTNTFAISAGANGAYNGATSVHTSTVLAAECELLVCKQSHPIHVGDTVLNYNVTVFNPNKFDVLLGDPSATPNPILALDDKLQINGSNVTPSNDITFYPDPNAATATAPDRTVTAEESKTYYVSIPLETTDAIKTADKIMNKITANGKLQITALDLTQ